MKNECNIIFVVIFMIMLLSVPVYIFVVEDKEFSENENRYLEQKPKINVDNILSGKFSKNFEKYIDDQFLFRETLYEIKTQIQILIGNRDINNVYIAKDNYLIEKKTDSEFNIEKLNENINNFNIFAEHNKDRNIQFIVVPTSGLILNDKLPHNASIYDQNEAIDFIKENVKYTKFIDLRETLLLHKNEYIYYKTDHHWTSLGSFYAYEEWCNQNSLKTDISNFNVQCIATDFKGSLYSKILKSNIENDKIEIFGPKNELSYSVEFNFGKTLAYSIYNFDKLSQKDKYQVFFGGNHSEIKIKVDNHKNNKILVIKDSFANSFIPFLINNYEEIYVVDMRYFKENLYDYLSLNHISEILVLYNLNSLLF